MAPGRRRRDADDEDAEDEQPQNRRKTGKGRRRQESDNESGEDSDAGDRTQNRSANTELRLAHKLVRYAIACEHSRTPVRREAVREKVYAGDSMRNFRNVYELAQIQLRTVFGMQLVEQPSKDRSLLSLDQKRKAAKSQKSAGPATRASTNTWILTTILPAPFRTPAVIAPSKVHSSEGEAAYVGLYTLLISLITLSGGEMRDAKFHQYLGRLNIETTVPSNNPNNRHQPSEATEAALQRMIRQGYLVKQVSGEENEDVNWYVGPRGKVEVDNEAIAAVVRRVYGDAGGAMLEKQLGNSLGVDARMDEEEDGDGDVDAEGEDNQQEEGPPRQRQRVNTLGRASPMVIRSRQEDGDPGPSSRRSGRLRA